MRWHRHRRAFETLPLLRGHLAARATYEHQVIQQEALGLAQVCRARVVPHTTACAAGQVSLPIWRRDRTLAYRTPRRSGGARQRSVWRSGRVAPGFHIPTGCTQRNRWHRRPTVPRTRTPYRTSCHLTATPRPARSGWRRAGRRRGMVRWSRAVDAMSASVIIRGAVRIVRVIPLDQVSRDIEAADVAVAHAGGGGVSRVNLVKCGAVVTSVLLPWAPLQRNRSGTLACLLDGL